jgi:hypothetical protein
LLIGFSAINQPANADLLDALKAVNQGLSALNGHPVNNSTGTPASQGIIRAKLTAEQEQQLNAELTKKVSNEKLRLMIQDASPTIGKVIGMEACFYNRDTYAPYSKNGMFEWSTKPGQGSFPHHDLSQCLNIQRVSNWEATALNSLAFKAVYVSAQSGESLMINYEIEKQTDGTWLFTH